MATSLPECTHFVLIVFSHQISLSSQLTFFSRGARSHFIELAPSRSRRFAAHVLRFQSFYSNIYAICVLSRAVSECKNVKSIRVPIVLRNGPQFDRDGVSPILPDTAAIIFGIFFLFVGLHSFCNSNKSILR